MAGINSAVPPVSGEPPHTEKGATKPGTMGEHKVTNLGTNFSPAAIAVGAPLLGVAALVSFICFPVIGIFIGAFFLGASHGLSKQMPNAITKALNDPQVQQAAHDAASSVGAILSRAFSESIEMKNAPAALSSDWGELKLTGKSKEELALTLAKAKGQTGAKEDQIAALREFKRDTLNSVLSEKLLHALAQVGDSQSQYDWGMRAFDSNITAHKPTKAQGKEYLEKASQQGHWQATLHLAKLHETGEAMLMAHPKQATKLYEKLLQIDESKFEREEQSALKDLKSKSTEGLVRLAESGSDEAAIAYARHQLGRSWSAEEETNKFEMYANVKELLNRPSQKGSLSGEANFLLAELYRGQGDEVKYQKYLATSKELGYTPDHSPVDEEFAVEAKPRSTKESV